MRRILNFQAEFASDTDRTTFISWFQTTYGSDYNNATLILQKYQIKGVFLNVHAEFFNPDTLSTTAPVVTTFPNLQLISDQVELSKIPIFHVTERI